MDSLGSRAPRPWGGAVFVGSGWLLYSGAVGRASLHRHHALQVLVARRGIVRLEDAHGRGCQGEAVAVAPDSPHALSSGLPSVHLLYLEAGSRLARCARAAGAGGIRSLGPGAQALAGLWRAPEPRSLDVAGGIARELARLVAPGELAGPLRVRHPSVRRAIALLPELIAEHGSGLRLPRIARAAGRSPQGFSRSFNQGTGLSVPAYVRWARLRLVARSLAGGASVTRAAQDAGFSDSAHLSRVFRDTFGIRPSDLAGCAHFEVADVELD